MKRFFLYALSLTLLLSFCDIVLARKDVLSLLKKNDACLLANPNGNFLVAVNIDTELTPASTLKIFTALVGFHHLGPDYRFPTDVFLSNNREITVKGYGDPMLVSEVMTRLAEKAIAHFSLQANQTYEILLDDAYFLSPLTIPGVSNSYEPYDAPNGALCANFNTITFKRTAAGDYISGEPQTPLLSSVIDQIIASGLTEGRIPNHQGITRYWGQLFRYFLTSRGLTVSAPIRIESRPPHPDARSLQFNSPYTLSDVITQLMAYSNNFIANQIFIAAGAKAFGAPGSLEKGVRAAKEYAANHLQLQGLKIVEGSGISRGNQLTARTMYRILLAFEPHAGLLRQTDQESYKTGTLNGIAARAGYIKGPNNTHYPFVIMLNGSSKKIEAVRDRLVAHCMKAGAMQ